MTKNEMLELKNGDFVQVKKGNKWYNGIVLSLSINKIFDSYKVYIHHFSDKNNEFGDTDYFSCNEIRHPNYDVTNNETLKKVKKLVDQLVVKGGK